MESKTARLSVIQTPFCGDLRSKKYFMRDEILTNAEDYHDASGHTWCYHTQMPIGPDGNRAAPEYCTPSRRCYRSALAQPVAYVPPKRNPNPEV
jgi:hypothetical protein